MYGVIHVTSGHVENAGTLDLDVASRYGCRVIIESGVTNLQVTLVVSYSSSFAIKSTINSKTNRRSMVLTKLLFMFFLEKILPSF